VFSHFEPRMNGRRRAPLGAFAVVAFVCLALLVLLAAAQVAHTHAANTDADHCQLCIVMHSVVPAAVAVALLALVQIATVTPVAKLAFVPRFLHVKLFSRPPPAR
jgi:hypothetical protein